MTQFISPYRKLEETQKKAEDLQNEVTVLYYEVAKLEIKISDLKNEKAKLQDLNFSQEFEIKLNRTLEKEVSGNGWGFFLITTEQIGIVIGYIWTEMHCRSMITQ